MQPSFSIQGFDEFLRKLDPDRDVAAEYYVRLRERLERFFEWRSCENVEELADTVIDRTIKKVAAGEEIQEIEAFCVAIAKYVLLEDRRESFRSESLDENYSDHAETDRDDDSEMAETRLKCLDDCLAELPADDRHLIINYFRTDEVTMIANRKTIAAKLGVTLNNLRIQVCRIKARLEKCTKGCCENR